MRVESGAVMVSLVCLGGDSKRSLDGKRPTNLNDGKMQLNLVETVVSSGEAVPCKAEKTQKYAPFPLPVTIKIESSRGEEAKKQQINQLQSDDKSKTKASMAKAKAIKRQSNETVSHFEQIERFHTFIVAFLI